MKKLYTIFVIVNEIDRMEKICNMHHIGLNDRDHSKVFEVQGSSGVVYTIMCTEEQFHDITNALSE